MRITSRTDSIMEFMRNTSITNSIMGFMRNTRNKQLLVSILIDFIILNYSVLFVLLFVHSHVYGPVYFYTGDASSSTALGINYEFH